MQNATTIGQAYTAAEEVEVLESQLEEQQRLFAKVSSVFPKRDAVFLS
jgi:hypothetical protein